MAASEQMRRRKRIGFMLLAGWSVGCAAARGAQRVAENRPGATPSPEAGSCLLERAPVVLADGVEVYIEPQNLLEVGGNVLVAGLPSFTWEVGSAPNAIRLTKDAHVAALREADAWTTVPKPPTDASLGTVRAVALDDGRWGALFSEEDADSLAKNKEYVLRLWYGEYDGAQWGPLEPVPQPAGMLFVNGSSRLVRVGERLVWAAVQYAPPGPSRMVFYERDRGRWTVEPMPGDGVDNAQLAYDETHGLLLVVFGEDPDLPGWQKSLRLYRRGRGWNLLQRIALPAMGAEVTTSVAADAAGVSVGWVESSSASSIAYAQVDVGPDGPGRRVVLDDSAEQLVSVSGLADGPVWIVDHSDSATGARELRFLRPSPRGPLDRLVSVPNPYTGYFAALGSGAGEILVAGPQFNPDPAHPVVRSLILRLSTNCD